MKNQQIINNWRIKLWDESDNEGAWTNGNDFFVMAGKRIQDLAYTYDNVGNVTQIVDQSETNTRKSATYAYDDLYRLTSATITDSATDEDYTQTYSYDSLGNFTNRSDMGDYEYEGNTGSSYANPHAMTDAGGVIVDYDHNGNLTSAYAGPYNLYAPTWDYNNRMVASAGTFQWPVEYLYDHAGSRVKMDANTGEEVIVYPNKYYELKTDGEVETVTESIYAQNQLVATLTDDGTTSSLYYVHGDHLGSSSVMTKDDANIEQIVDYYPYGNTRFNQQSDPENGSYDIDKKFTSHFYDKHTDLTYMGARYYIGVAGKFISQDPLFQNLGTDVKKKYNKEQLEILSNPQELNSYSYVVNNPLNHVDPNGESTWWAWLFNTRSTLNQVNFWQGVAQSYFSNRGDSISANLLKHSLKLNPEDIVASLDNQYSNIVETVQSSKEYNNMINNQLVKAEKEGRFTIDTQTSLLFTSKDLSTSLQRAGVGINAHRLDNGSWDTTVTITDTYDFQYQNYNNPVLDSGNNAALLSQTGGAISNYGVTINIHEARYSYRTK